MQCNGLGVSSFTWNGKRYMTPGGTCEYISSLDSIEVEIESRRKFKTDDFCDPGELKLLLKHNGKKQYVTIEHARVGEYQTDFKTKSTKVVFFAPSIMEPVPFTNRYGFMTWTASSESKVTCEEPTDDADEQEYEDYGYCEW